MTLSLELGGIKDPAVVRAFQRIAKQFPIVATGGGGAPSGPAGGDLTGTYPNPSIAALAVTDAKVAAANKDGTAATPSMRTLGTGAAQAAAGNDSRLSDARTPTAHQTTHQAGNADALSGNLNAVARSNVMKAGVTTGTRRAVNFIEGANVTITEADDSVNEKVDVTIAAAAGGGVTLNKTIIATSEARTNTAYGTLATPDQVTGIVVAANATVWINYKAEMTSTVANTAFAAVFIGANQLRIQSTTGTAVQETSGPGTANSFVYVGTTGAGLAVGSGSAGYTGDVTTGQILGPLTGSTMTPAPGASPPPGWICAKVAAGTYTISVQFKATSGTVTVKNRELRVFVI